MSLGSIIKKMPPSWNTIEVPPAEVDVEEIRELTEKLYQVS